jgi:tRNA-Thr(GGU) m(6)t(6)A37 methyltransferase TsaA
MVLLDKIPIQPIGVVKNNLRKRSYNEWRDTESEIIISEEFQDALYRLEEYSHIEVIFYVHEMNRPFVTRIHPTGNPDYPLMGAFATRTPNRPSKIALTTCKLLDINENILRVQGLDAYDSTPVIDIKSVSWRNEADIRMPNWIKDLKKKMTKS